ncbi:MAG TPA: hypothetical protein DDW54_02980, partial [Clostridiales bacterium]|nr:hypothetical protein [Clostridiales bacterium]
MRKFRIGLILAAMAVAAFLPFANPAPAAADDTPTIGTEMFLPTSYLQYYKLENPYAICRYSDAGGDVVAISHQGKIVVYKNETFLAMDISDLNNTVGVPNLFIYRNFLLFSASNKLFYVDISDGSAFTRKTLDGVTCSCFAIFGDSLCVATNSDINFYDFYYSASDLSVTELPSKKIERNNVTNIHLSKDGYVYYSDQNTDIYRKDPEDASSPEERLNAAETIEGIKCICENPDPSDDNLYFSCTNGIFSFSKATGTASEIVRSSVKTADADISSVYEPQGICIVEGKLWIVDKYIKAVQEIDLTDNEFTEFAITTNSRAVNRLNDAIDITIDGDKLYALDENKSIVVINNVGGIRTYNRIALPEAATAFSAG